jgi:uncharacterized protein (DUF302 family)
MSEGIGRAPQRRRTLLASVAFFASGAMAAALQGARTYAAGNGAKRMSSNGLVTIPSTHSVKETIDRIEAEIKSKGLTVFARIDHAAGAKEVGLPLAPTLLLIFGNARGGTPLMQAKQPVGIDLPLKVLAWQDSASRTWLTYNDPHWIARRHDLGHEVDQTVKALSEGIAAIVNHAAT